MCLYSVQDCFFASFRFRKLSLKYHPDKNQDVGTEMKFKHVAEAYDVLHEREYFGVISCVFWWSRSYKAMGLLSNSDICITAKTRAVYNQFGEEGLKGGVPDKGWYKQFSINSSPTS